MILCDNCHTLNPSEAAYCKRCNGDISAITQDPRVGEVIASNFRLKDLIGIGAMGKVYVAEQMSLGKDVAVKVLHPHLHEDPMGAKRFHREALAASRLNHPNIIQIYDFGESGSDLYIAMEYLDGMSLDTLLAKEFPLAIERVIRIMVQVCSALEEAHQQGIIHRDLKLENIMIVSRRSARDTVKVLDFGIAKMQRQEGPSEVTVTTAGNVAGTPEYMSPEQARHEKLDARSDLYAIGVCLYNLVTGRLPFVGETPLAVVTQHLMDDVTPPRQLRPDLEIPEVIEGVILRCLAKRPADRPSSAAELGALLQNHLASTLRPTPAPVPAAPPEPAQSSLLSEGVVVDYDAQSPDAFMGDPTTIVKPDYDESGRLVGGFDLDTDPEPGETQLFAEVVSEDVSDTDVGPAFTAPDPEELAGSATPAGSRDKRTKHLLIYAVLLFVLLGILAMIAVVALVLFWRLTT